MIALFLKYFSLLVFCLLIFGFTGHYLLRLFGLNFKPSRGTFLFSLFFGLNIFVIVLSVFFTKGVTVNMVLIPLWIFLIWEIRKNPFNDKYSVSPDLTFWHYGKLFFFNMPYLLFIFSLAFFYNVQQGGFYFSLIPTDDCFYSEISQFLPLTGKENIYNALNLISPDYNGTIGYHYFDLWFNAGISLMFQTNNMQTLLLVTYPLFFFLLLQGYLMFLEFYNAKFKLKFLFSIFALFLSGIILGNYPSIIANGAPSYLTNIIVMPKLGIVTVSLILFIWFVFNDRNFIGLIVLSIIPIFYFTTAPAIYGGLIILLLTNRYHRILKHYEFRPYICYFLLSLIPLTAFYLIFGNKIINFSNKIYFYEFFQTVSYKVVLRRLITFIHPFVFVPIVYGPFLFAIIVGILVQNISLKRFFEKELKVLFLVFFATCFCGISAWSLAYYNPDSFQLSQNLNGPYFKIILILIMSRLLCLSTRKARMVGVACTALFFMLNVNYIYYGSPLTVKDAFENAKKMLKFELNVFQAEPSEAYMDSIRDFFTQNPHCNKIGVSLNHPSEFTTINLKTVTVNEMAPYMKYMDNGFALIGINDFDIPISTSKPFQVGVSAFEKEIEEAMLPGFPFYRFVKEQQKLNMFESIEKSQVDFIEAYKINYIMASSKAEIPLLIRAMVKVEIKDPVSGDRFIILKKRI